MVGNFIRASKRNPCVICRGDHSCSTTSDGLHFCRRTRGDVPGFSFRGETKNSIWGIYLASGGHSYVNRQRSPSDWGKRAIPNDKGIKKKKIEPPAKDWDGIAARSAEGVDLSPLAKELGVRENALRELKIGYWGPEEYENCWTVPERNSDGKVVGIQTRERPSGLKRCHQHSRRALTYSDDFKLVPGPVLVVEGMSDVAAAITLNLRCIGQPGAGAGIEQLTELLKGTPKDEIICILIENDQKPDGCWPGKEGALKTAQALAKDLDRTIHVSRVPDGAKDLRAWLQRRKLDLQDVELLEATGKELLSTLMTTAVEINPPTRTLKISDALPPETDSDLDPDSDTYLDTEPSKGIPELVPFDRDFRPGKGRGCLMIQEFRDAADPRLMLHGRVLCGRWSCEICRPRNQKRWTRHFQKIIPKLERAYVWIGSRSEWETVRKAIKRAEGQYVRVRLEDGRLFVVASVSILGSEENTGATAFDKLAKVIAQLRGQRPISTSKGWAPPKHVSTRPLQRIGSIGSHSLRTEKAILGSFRIYPKVWGRFSRGFEWMVEFPIPHDWTEDDFQEFYYDLSQGKMPNQPAINTG